MTAPEKVAYSLDEAADLTPFSRRTLERAIHNREPGVFPFVLRSKKDSRGRFVIKRSELEAWIDRLEDA